LRWTACAVGAFDMGDRFLVFDIFSVLLVLTTVVVFEKLSHLLFFGNVRQIVFICFSEHASFSAYIGHGIGIRGAISPFFQCFTIAATWIVFAFRECGSVAGICISVET